MGELTTLYYSNFAILGERAKDFAWQTGSSNCIADWTLRSQIFLNKLRREHPAWTTAHRQEWVLFILEHLLHNAASMKKKEHWRHSWRSQAEETKEVAPECPLIKTLKGATDDTIIQLVKQVYWGEWTLVPSVLFCNQHNDCMIELQQDLSWHMASTGLQGTPSLTRSSRSRIHSHGQSASWSHSPSAEPWSRETAKWPGEDSPTGQSELWQWCSQLRGRSRSRQCQGNSPECWRQSLSSSLGPPRSSPSGKWLFLHM